MPNDLIVIMTLLLGMLLGIMFATLLTSKEKRQMTKYQSQDAPEWVYIPRWPDGEHSFWVAVAMDEEQIVLEFEEFQQMYDTGFCGTVYAWAYRIKPEPPEVR